MPLSSITARISFFLFGLFIISCSQPGDQRPSKTDVDAFRKAMNQKFMELYGQQKMDSAGSYLDGLKDTVESLHDDRLTLNWNIQKVQQFINYREHIHLDSANMYMHEAMALLRSKGMNYKDSFNTYITYLHLLKEKGLKDSAIQVANQAFYLARNDSVRVFDVCHELAEIYGELNDYPNIRKYGLKAWDLRAAAPEQISDLAQLLMYYYDQMNKEDSALYYLHVFETTPGIYDLQPAFIAALHESAGLFLAKAGRAKEGLQQQLIAKHILDSMGVHNSGFYNNLADTYMHLHKFRQAFLYIDSSIYIAHHNEDDNAQSLAWRTKSEVYFQNEQLKQAYAALDSSYFYYANNADSSLSRYSRELEVKYGAREKDNQIIALNERNRADIKIRKQEETIIAIIIVLVLVLLVNGLLLWRRRKTKMLMRENDLKQHLLRAQMNTHFLFNSLANLKNLVRKGNQEQALESISQLGKLTRFYFEIATEKLILLKNELEALEAYLKLQLIGRPGLFSYEIQVYSGYEGDEVYIPALLIQPLVENAIIHGFTRFTNEGLLTVRIEKREKTLLCTVEDNGLPNKVTAQSKRLRSTAINQERLAILSRQTGIAASFNILEKGNQENGYRVELEIPYLENESIN